MMREKNNLKMVGSFLLRIGAFVKQKIIKILTLLIISTLFCVGCGRSTVSTFKADMEKFLVDLTKIDTQMNAIDPDSTNAVKEMLECIDALDKGFADLANINVPTEFSAIESLADEASEYMSMALENYNTAFATEDYYDESYGTVAAEYFARAMKRKEYIAIILQGGTPEGEGVSISYDDENGIVPEGSVDIINDNSISNTAE